MIRATVFWFSAGPLLHLTGRITANKYPDILNDELSSMLSTAIFED